MREKRRKRGNEGGRGGGNVRGDSLNPKCQTYNAHDRRHCCELFERCSLIWMVISMQHEYSTSLTQTALFSEQEALVQM